MNSSTTSQPIPAAYQKQTWIAYILFLFLGFLGAHKFYLGKVAWGIVYILTGGIFLIGLLIDLFSIPAQVRNYNQGLISGNCWS